MSISSETAASPAKPVFAKRRDVAALLGVHISTVKRMLAQGLPHLRLSERVTRFDLDDVAAWAKQHRTGVAK